MHYTNPLSVFIPIFSVCTDLKAIILVPSCFLHEDASNHTHDDPNDPTVHIHPDQDQGQYSSMDFITSRITPSEWAMPPEYCQFSDHLVKCSTSYLHQKNCLSKNTKCLQCMTNVTVDAFWCFWVTFSIAIRYAIKWIVWHLNIKMA